MASDTPVPDPLTKLPLNAMITPVPVSNERGHNLTNITSLKVQNDKGGLGHSPSNSTHENNKSNNKLMYLHITNVLLGADNKNYNHHQIGHALEQHAYTLQGLLNLIRTPRNIVDLRWKDKDDGNKEKMLTDEQYEDLLALYPFFCMLQNGHGPIADGLFDIFATTRLQFEHFITEGEFKVYAPILYDEDAALISQQQRRSGLGQDGNRTTTSVYDIKLWATQFNPITGDIAIYPHCTEELFCDEINWPPLLCWDEYYIDYINRVLSQDFSTVYKNNNPPEHSLDTIATTKNKESQTELVTGDDNTTSIVNKGEDNINGGLNGTNGGEGSSGEVSTTKGDKVINPPTNNVNYYGEVVEGGINVVDSEEGEVKLFGGGRSDPDIRSSDSGLESSDTNISGADDDITTKIATADECRNATGPEFLVMFKAKRNQDKTIRRSLSRHITGSGRRYHKAVHKMQPSVVVIQSHARMFLARRKVIPMRGGVYRRIRANDIKHEPTTSPVHSYIMPGTRRINSQASELFPSSSLVTLLEKNDGYNGEMGDAWNIVDPSIPFSAKVFAIHMPNQGPLPFPKVLWTWGEESGCTLHVRLEGECVEKVEVDRGAWAEYDDNPINVRDWKRIMIDVRRFTGQVFAVYDMYTSVMVGGTTFNVFNPKTGVVLYLLDVKMTSDELRVCHGLKATSDELRVCHSLKVDDHDDNDDSLPDPRLMVEMIGTSGYTEARDPQVTPSHVYRWGENTNSISFTMSNNPPIETPQAATDILLSPCSRSECADIVYILLRQWKGQPTRCIEQVLELQRDKEAVIWGASEHGGRLQLSEEDTTATQPYTVGINSNNSVGISNDKFSISYTGGCVNDTIGTPLIDNSVSKRSDTGRSIPVNATIVDGHVLVTSGTATQQHKHGSSAIGGMLLRHQYIHPADTTSVTRLFYYGEIPTSDDMDISTVTDNNINGYRSIIHVPTDMMMISRQDVLDLTRIQLVNMVARG